MYMHQIHEIYLKASKIIIHYVQGTRHFGVHYIIGYPPELVGFFYSNWDGDHNDRKSSLGYVFMIVQGTICCSRNKQYAIYLS